MAVSGTTATTLSPTQTASAVGASMNFAKFDEGACVAAVFNGAQLSAASFASTHLVAASFQDNGANATQLTPSSDITHTSASVYKADIRGTKWAGYQAVAEYIDHFAPVQARRNADIARATRLLTTDQPAHLKRTAWAALAPTQG